MQSFACVLLCFLINNCFGELSIEKKEKILNGFVEYLNNLPNQPYSYEEGYILNAQKTNDANCYNIETLLLSRPANDLDKAKYQKCYATILDLDENGISIQNNQHHCEDSDLVSQPNSNDETKLEEVVIDEISTTTEANVGHEPVQLDNEIQMNAGITSGEQFIAVPRKKPGGACMGCSSHVNPQAPGVTELATLGVKHLNIHEQNIKHTLEAILDVERQVQVVNGVRYILTLLVGYDPCSTTNEGCLDKKVCKISILEKSWIKSPDGSKYRAILSNNCTEQWQFGDEGEIITNESVNTVNNYNENKPSTNDPITDNPGSVDEVLKTIHNFDIQSQPHQGKEISDEEIKRIQEQIVPHDHIYATTSNINELTKTTESSQENVRHVNNVETVKQDIDNSISLKHPLYQEKDSFLSEDRKKAIDDLINFFDSAGFDGNEEKFSRIRRSYEHDLKVMALAEKIHKIKKNIKNAKFLYALAQDMIDYLNEIDFEIKTRSLVEVLTAEEEFENHQHFFYIQTRVIIPCDKADCEESKGELKICTGVIEAKEKESPQILNAFCYDDKQNHAKFSKPESIDLNDPVLKKLVHEALKKIERESLNSNAMKIEAIVQPTIQKSSGVHTKFTISLSYTNCNKTVPYVKRRNCTVIKSMDSSICDVKIHQRHWLKERKIAYSCITRPFDDRFSNNKEIVSDPIRMQDPKILEMVQEALQYLESNSNRNNKQKVVEIKSVSTQLLGGLITEIEFVAGYTECSNEFQVDLKTCKLLENETLRKCKAEVWDRPWVSDGRQINVTCDDSFPEKTVISRNKRAIPGSQQEKSPDDPQYKQLAQESLQKYLQDKDIKDVFDDLKVEKVTEQVVAGILTRIHFKTKSDNKNEIFCKSKIWEKPWIKFKEINVTCEEVSKPLRKKRSSVAVHLVGAPEAVNPKDSKYLHLARKSLKQYLQNNGVDDKFEVLEVNNVTEQVVAGTLTEIHFTVSPENIGDEIKCVSKVWEKPWMKFEEITVSCEESLKEKRLRKKRSTHAYPLVGAPELKDSKDIKYLHLAQKSLTQYLQNNQINDKFEVLEVNKVTIKVVSGTLTEIHFTISPENNGDEIKCVSKVWEKPWMKFEEITVNCEESMKEKRLRKRRSSVIDPLVGAPEALNPKDSKYLHLARKSLKQYLQNNGVDDKFEVLEVNKVTEQVVAGTLTEIHFTVSPENNGDEIKCVSKVWEKSWMKFEEITVNCEESIKEKRLRKRRSSVIDPLVGAPEALNPKDSKYLHLARKSLKQYLQNNGVDDKFEVLEVNKVTEQVVAGTLTEIHFTVSPENNDGKISCHSEVWEKPWEDFEEITVSCEKSLKEKGLRKKRFTDAYSLVGAPKLKDSKDIKYLHLAQKSLTQYLQNNQINDKFEVLEVNKVTIKVVSGTLTEIHFTISPENNGDEIKCVSKVWEKPWMKFEEITVNCEESMKEKRLRKRRSSVIDPLVGAPEALNPKDSKYLHLARKSLKQYLQNNGVDDKFKVLEVNKVTEQVVAGTLTEIHFTVSPENIGDEIKCVSKVWEKPWMKLEEITVSCEESLIEKRLRKKRYLKGQLVKHNPNKAEYKKLADKSLTHYLLIKKIKKLHKVISVEHVTSQLVSGMIYNIDFIASPICSSNINKTTVMCNKTDTNKLYCHTKIWKQPWRKQENIDVDCNNDVSEEDENDSRKKRSIMFGTSTQNNVNNEKYKSLVEEAVKKYQQLSNTKYMHKIIEIHNASEQVVSGVLTKLDFSISPTKCLLEDNAVHVDDCKLQSSENTLRCQAQVWVRPWLKSSNEIEVYCNELKKERLENFNLKNSTGRTKRQIGPEEDDIDEDTKYYYADRVVHHINARESTNNLQKLITIHAFESSTNMGVNMIRMFIEVGYTYCLKHEDEAELENCEELSGSFHRLCHVRLWPSPDDELVVQSLSVVCDDEKDFKSVTGLSITNLIKEAIKELESSPKIKNKMVHLGEPYVAPSLDSRNPTKISFIVRTTNCSKYIDIEKNRLNCFIDNSRIPKSCNSYIWMMPNTKKIRKVTTNCDSPKQYRSRRSLSFDTKNTTADEKIIQNLVKESLDKLEMSSVHKYKQKLLQINSVISKISKGRITIIDFDVAYTTCLKYEWVENMTDCEVIEHLPRRHCISQVSERLWIQNGREISVNCEDDETPLESHIEYETADNGMVLANEALKHIEAKYPHPYRQKIVRVFSLEKQLVAGLHFRMKVEVGLTDCLALSLREDCKLVKNGGTNKFCRVNIWLRPWSEHPPHYRVTCDYQDANSHDLFFEVQAERLFTDFLATYTPDYINNKPEIVKRYNIFKDNVKRIHELNIYERGTARYGVTRFADLSYDEFVSKYMGLKTSLRSENNIPMRKAEIPEVSLPESFDWREYDAVTEVKDQGSCGSCWAFSVTGNIEGQYKVQSGELVSLSEQELVDCDKLDDGCNGGLPDNAYRAIEQLGGLELETDYPYEGENDKCVFNKTLSRVQISGAVNISSDETEMAKWLIQNGPISIGINANAMQFYVGGISHPWKFLCSSKNLDHGVLIVGYGVKNYPLFHKRLPYWIIKNSWGKSWGEQGYYRVYRGDGTCGVNQMASSALI